MKSGLNDFELRSDTMKLVHVCLSALEKNAIKLSVPGEGFRRHGKNAYAKTAFATPYKSVPGQEVSIRFSPDVERPACAVEVTGFHANRMILFEAIGEASRSAGWQHSRFRKSGAGIVSAKGSMRVEVRPGHRTEDHMIFVHFHRQ